ncbi:TolC family protein [Deinococcus lacus]|uniref:TolC family protein n=1 Tax=Deinococcus lacus TaxID=392561 RepID=A0ABW1YIL2_9DEIO
MSKFKLPLSVALILLAASPAYAVYSTAALSGPALSRAVSVQLAASELEQARAGLTRVQGDPLALRPDLMAAQARLQQAEASQRLTGLQVRAALAAELATLSGAEYDLRLAQARSELAALNLQAAQVRRNAGAATALDLENAQTEATNAAAAVTQAKEALAAAQAAVKARAGTLPAAAKTLSFPQPKLETLRSGLAQHPRLLRAQAEAEKAELDLTIKSTDLSAPVEVQAARDALLGARKNVEDTQLDLTAKLNEAWQTYSAARSTVQSRQRSAAGAAEQARVQESRFSAGLVSRAELLKARTAALEAEAQLDAARASLETALSNLSVAANLKVWQ